MKIYFTMTAYDEEANDFSFYGIFAEDNVGGEKVFLQRKEDGKWIKVECRKQIKYYENCKKINLIDFLCKKDKSTLKIFQRIAPRENGHVNGVAVSEYARQYGFSPEQFQDKRFMNEKMFVAVQLPEGSLLAFEDSVLENGDISGETIKVIDKRYVQDKKYVFDKTNLKVNLSELAEELQKDSMAKVERENSQEKTM